MGKYDAYLVCENGHGVNDSFYSSPSFNKEYCTTCGAKILKTCSNCGNDIQGDYKLENVIDLSGGITPVPDICKYCGKDFPWRSKKQRIKENIKTSDKNDIFLLETIMDRFHLVAKQLRQRYNERETLDIKDEYDTQDLFHSLLRIYYDDIRAEEWNPSYAGGSTRSDFLLKKEQVVIEIKTFRRTINNRYC